MTGWKPEISNNSLCLCVSVPLCLRYSLSETHQKHRETETQRHREDPMLKLIFVILISCVPVFAQDDMRYFITRSGDRLMEGDKEYRFISFNIPSLHLVEDTMAFEA